jgi:type VI secretion system protein ImpJ
LIGEEIEDAQNTTCLVIGKLIVEAGNLRLDETFFPPCAHIGAFAPLSKKIESLIETLQIKAAQLTNTASPWRFETDSIDSGWLRDRLIHSELAQALIETEHRVRVQAPPAHVFEALASLIGRLSALAGFKNVEIPIWDAGDQSRSFFAAGSLLDALFDQLRSGPDATAVFKLRDGWFEARVPASAHIGEFSAFLVLEQANEAQMFSATMAKLASLQRIETVVSRALPGIPIERIERPPYGLRSGSDTIVWRIDVNDPLWREAQSSGAVCLHWHGLAKTARMHLVYYRG